MLILTRKVGEVINIGDDISVCVIEISKGNVKLGINAPKDVSILRQEIMERIVEENIESAQAEPAGLLKALSIMKNTDSKEI